MIRRMLGTLLLLAVIGVAANDGWRVANAEKHLRGVTYDLTKWAAENAQDLTRDEAAARILADAQAQGVKLYAYDQTERAVRIYTSEDVTGTIVAGLVFNLIEGAGLNTSLPLVLRDHRDAGFAR